MLCPDLMEEYKLNVANKDKLNSKKWRKEKMESNIKNSISPSPDITNVITHKQKRNNLKASSKIHKGISTIDNNKSTDKEFTSDASKDIHNPQVDVSNRQNVTSKRIRTSLGRNVPQ
ncbi:hypothetical protein DICPUDRAFT_83756 [Dictyostelium purpureum]|uniref:Uncharacterized protein n=1 Tax=Dictyostelium purpureum TaxID=5786 RepID=F1A0I8_DICPU|nr:uncharacterized protein DICPUDRAFT_83756 [Dictyostelium purpureum]EGC30296.1 hypothetical protein DICPUDRAFT_83756 [Dictyostelium purpureum]|eukprot:XP_003293175.1 hypothetical protein DICPUDRAFT_83756 [Dictyostelium purpureum]